MVETLKYLENLFVRFLFDADAVVFEKQADAAVMRLRRDPHARCHAGRNELHRVAEKI